MRKLILLTLLGVGCNDITLTKVVEKEPDIIIYPEHIDFGHLISGVEIEQESFTVINAGDEPLVIDSPVLISGNGRFELLNDNIDSYIIEGGGLVEFSVDYDPETFESNGGLIEILSNDKDEPESIITLEGYGDAPVMTIFPETFDYGTISMGCDNEERITVRNEGNLPLIIETVTQMVTQPADIKMEYGSLPEPPWELQPNQEIDFLVSYIPSDIGLDESNIAIRGNDPQNPEIEVLQYGDGVYEQWITQEYIQEEIPLLDIIFVIDNSGSMNIFHQHLASQMTNFMNAFVISGADYHMSFVTTDKGYFQGSGAVYWIDNTFINPIDWAQGVITGIGVHGSAYEKGIEYARAVLQNTDSLKGAAPGTPFWRDDATLVIIYVSDEPDFSAGTWNSYTSFFDTIKTDVNLVRHFGVIGDYPSGCSYQYGNYFRTVGFGSGYWNMTQRYNGDWYSICAADWGQQMQDLADTVTTRKIFAIDEPDPIENSIIVYVNGQLVTNWSYDLNSNSIIFDDNAVPEPSQTIKIEYAIWGC